VLSCGPAAADPRVVNTDGTVLDLRGKVFSGAQAGTPADRFEGIGLIVENCRNVKIIGGRFSGFRCAILVRNCRNVLIEKAEVSGNFAQRLRSTPEREFAGDWLWPHRNDKQEWRRSYGAGICIENSSDCIVRQCKARRQQNGIILDRCTKCEVYDNDMSFLSGWGLAMWRSSKNVVAHNSFDWCVRGHSHGVYDRGQDSAGILVFEQCSRNLFARNSATHGGDGFFLYAGHETTRKTGAGGCNDNRVINNDFSHAVANAIEATFSSGNWFEGNRCDDSNYGVWAGYSYENVFLGNTCSDNSIAGVAIEHGEHNLILANDFSGNPTGVSLWWDDDRELLASAFGKKRPCLSRAYWIVGNTFTQDRVAVRLSDTPFVALSGNSYVEVGATLKTSGACFPVQKLHGRHPLVMQPTAVKVPGRRKAFLAAGHPRGRRHIMIDEWGPLDPTKPAVFPRQVVGWGRCVFRVLGGGEEELAVEGIGAPLRAEISGNRVVIRSDQAGLHAFRGTIRIGGLRFAVSGTLLNATWRVTFWERTADPRKADVFAAAPARTETVRKLDYRWEHKGDRFATRAVTKLTLPAGKYVVRTVSDDGIRVRIDGRVVQEDWTHHGPTEHRTIVELAGGEHEIVVEHFELSGYAVLAFDLRPAK